MEPGKPRLPLSVPLVPFTSPDPLVSSLGVTVERPQPTLLQLAYRLEGDLAALLIPLPGAAPERRDGLWRHTCFEAFAGPVGTASYREYNLAPSGDWAVYAFDGYRSGMQPLAAPAPVIEVQQGEQLLLTASLEVPAGPLRLALAAVLERRDGTLGYWALRHGRERPDFHHADGFALTLQCPGDWHGGCRP